MNRCVILQQQRKSLTTTNVKTVCQVVFNFTTYYLIVSCVVIPYRISLKLVLIDSCESSSYPWKPEPSKSDLNYRGGQGISL